MPIRDPVVSLNVTPLYAIVDNHQEKMSRRVQVHGNEGEVTYLLLSAGQTRRGLDQRERHLVLRDGSALTAFAAMEGGRSGRDIKVGWRSSYFGRPRTHRLGRHLRTSRAKISGTPSASRPSSERHATSSMSCTRLDPGTGTEGGRETVDR